jgi:hypothetical protein
MGQLLTDALVIKNETQISANTATRVGGWMEDAATYIEETPSVLSFFSNNVKDEGLINDLWVPTYVGTTQGFARNGLTVSEDGLVTYAGSSKHFKVSALITLSGQHNRVMHFAVFKNGELIANSEFVSIIPSEGQTTITSQCVVELEDDGQIQMYVKCSSHNPQITIDNLNVIINEF